jgi:hypothetical protein
MIAMPVRCDMPLFAHRATTELMGDVPASRRRQLAEAVRAVLPEATVIADDAEVVVVADPRAEVTLRAANGTPTLEVTSSDAALARRIREVVADFLAAESP